MNKKPGAVGPENVKCEARLPLGRGTIQVDDYEAPNQAANTGFLPKRHVFLRKIAFSCKKKNIFLPNKTPKKFLPLKKKHLTFRRLVGGFIYLLQKHVLFIKQQKQNRPVNSA